MNLLPWFLKIPGHEQNVRIPSAPATIVVVEDTIENEQPPMTFTWGSFGGDSSFDMSFAVKQGIPADLTWESLSKQPSKEEQATFEYWENQKWWSKNPYPSTRSPEERLYDSNMSYEQYKEQEYERYRIGPWTDETVPQIFKVF